MDLSELEQACQKHKKQKQLPGPGVCSSCLRERLSKLYAASKKEKPKVEYSSSFTTTSKLNFHARHYRTSSDAMGSFSVVPCVNCNQKKDRSIALASRSHGRNFSNWERGKDGFWSKLLHFTKKRN